MLINNNSILRLARESAYNWMTSLAPVRTAIKLGSGRRACCGRKPDVAVPDAVYSAVGGNATFKAELAKLRVQLGAVELHIAVGRHRFLIR